MKRARYPWPAPQSCQVSLGSREPHPSLPLSPGTQPVDEKMASKENGRGKIPGHGRGTARTWSERPEEETSKLASVTSSRIDSISFLRRLPCVRRASNIVWRLVSGEGLLAGFLWRQF